MRKGESSLETYIDRGLCVNKFQLTVVLSKILPDGMTKRIGITLNPSEALRLMERLRLFVKASQEEE